MKRIVLVLLAAMVAGWVVKSGLVGRFLFGQRETEIEVPPF